jgi:hypothetical protein
MDKKWVVIVYDHGDKIGSHIFRGETELEVTAIAESWVESNFGQGRDWVVHHVHDG